MLTLSAQEQYRRAKSLREQRRVFAIVMIAFAVACFLIVALAPHHPIFRNVSMVRYPNAGRRAALPTVPNDVSKRV